jgi:hypothetical protein
MKLKIDIRYVLFFYLALASCQFFRLKFLPIQFFLLLRFSGVVLMFATIVLDYIYFRTEKIKQGFSGILAIIFCGIITSTISAYIFHGQGVALTIWIGHSVYYYLLYYFLHIIKFKPEELNRLLVIMGVIYLGSYLLQYIIYPTVLFNFRIQESRGTVRIFLYGSSFLAYAYYYSINQFYLNNKPKYIILALSLFLFYILNGSRSSLLIVVAITAMSLVFSKKVKSRFLIIFLFMVAGTSIVIAFKDIFLAMIEVSNKQIGQEDEDIRIRAMKFFMTKFQPSFWTYILGNGEGHQASAYGLQIYSYKVLFGFYQSDIGIVGVLAIYGAIFVLGGIASIIAVFKRKLPPKYRFIKYFMLDVTISLTSGMAFSVSYYIMVAMGIFYILDYLEYQQSKQTETVHDE